MVLGYYVFHHSLLALSCTRAFQQIWEGEEERADKWEDQLNTFQVISVSTGECVGHLHSA